MTEAEWLACEEPVAMTEFLKARASERRNRLVIAGCFRRLLLLLATDSDLHQLALSVVAVAEQFADSNSSQDELQQARDRIEAYWQGALDDPQWLTAEAMAAMLSTNLSYAVNGISFSLDAAAILASAKPRSRRGPSRVGEQLAQVGLIRDIFGNPFRPVAFSPAWRTDTAVALAEQMYESRDFGAMPILADALQDAGCDSEEVLSHCRGVGPHVRGCWVVDLVLDKE
jgi:hypothetical protein